MWGRLTVGAVAALLVVWQLTQQGWIAVRAWTVGIVAFGVAWWFAEYLYRLNNWYQLQSYRQRSPRCPNCRSRVDRMPRDWIAQCNDCGWKPGFPAVRWLTESVPAQQLQATVYGPLLPVVAIISILLLTGALSAASMAAWTVPAETPSGTPTEEMSVETTTVTPEPSGASSDNDRQGLDHTPVPTPEEWGEGKNTPRQTTERVDNPWRKKTLVVTVTNESKHPGDYHDYTQRAIDWWNGKRIRRYAEYQVTFELNRSVSGDEADVVIEIVEDIDYCGGTVAPENVVGCASTLNVGNRIEEATVYITNINQNDEIVEIIIHELGHILGLEHDDEPQDIMSQDY